MIAIGKRLCIRIVDASESKSEKIIEKNDEFIRIVQELVRRELTLTPIPGNGHEYTSKEDSEPSVHQPLNLFITDIVHSAPNDKVPLEVTPKLMEKILISLYNLESRFYGLKPGQIIVHSKLAVFFPDSALTVKSSLKDPDQEETLVYFISNDPSSPLSTNIRHDNVVLGGTFDYLHAGHKILLSMASWFASKRLVVGVSGKSIAVCVTLSNQQIILWICVSDFPPERVAKKRYSEYMEPLETRIETVCLFLQDLVRPLVLVQVEGIKDDFGPTRTDPNMNLLVGSVETALGCDMGTYSRSL